MLRPRLPGKENDGQMMDGGSMCGNGDQQEIGVKATLGMTVKGTRAFACSKILFFRFPFSPLFFGHFGNNENVTNGKTNF